VVFGKGGDLLLKYVPVSLEPDLSGDRRNVVRCCDRNLVSARLRPEDLGRSNPVPAYYSAFLPGVDRTAPGYIERVRNLGALSGLRIVGMPIEEPLFATAFGAYWSGAYDHFT